jgi:hypothetical protein
VWADHLLPLLKCKEAARLGGTCKALRAVVREHLSGDLGRVHPMKLRAALTTFPMATMVELDGPANEYYDDTRKQEMDALVEWMREGGHGRCLRTVRARHATNYSAHHAIQTALRGGLLPSLQGVDANLHKYAGQKSLEEGLFRGIHELRLHVEQANMTINGHDEFEWQLAALGLVRQLPALAKLEVFLGGSGGLGLYEWPSFIPPSLKTLRIGVARNAHCPGKDLLRALPGMLGTSGARLDRLEVVISSDLALVDGGLTHITQALRCCDPTVRGFRLATEGPTTRNGMVCTVERRNLL